MELKKAEGAIAARRDFLKRSAASVAAAGAVAVAGKSASAGETIKPKGAASPLIALSLKLSRLNEK